MNKTILAAYAFDVLRQNATAFSQIGNELNFFYNEFIAVLTNLIIFFRF